MKYLKIAALFSIVMFLTSCEDFFEQTTTIDIPEHVSKLGVTALWIDEGNDMLVTVFASVGALEDENSSAVSGATITLTENGNPIGTFEENSTTKGYYRPVSEITLTAGSTYELTVSAANFETVKATQVMPKKPIIKSAKYVTTNNKLHVTISDRDGEDFYVIGIMPGDTVGYAYVYSTSGIAEDSGLDYERVILNDKTFSGNDLSQTFEAYVNGSSTGNLDSVIVNLFDVTSDYYRLDRTFNASENSEDNPFAEPVILHRNFEKGFGVFALGARTSLKIPVK